MGYELPGWAADGEVAATTRQEQAIGVVEIRLGFRDLAIVARYLL